jgi:hypothetical protein
MGKSIDKGKEMKKLEKKKRIKRIEILIKDNGRDLGEEKKKKEKKE